MARNRVLDSKEFSKIYGEAYYNRKNTSHCIFISHKNEDSRAAKEISEYIIRNAKIDVYLDQRDSGLQGAVQRNDHKSIVKYIEKGIYECTHILCLVTEKTKESWWVPYEIGYAKKSLKEIVSLKLKDVYDFPSFLKIETVLNGTKSLNEYLKNLKNKNYNYDYNFIPNNQDNHPLDSYLNWRQ